MRAGLKPCARQLYPSRLHAITAANRYNLNITFASFCVQMLDDGWSTKGVRSDTGHVVAYLSYDETVCEQAMQAEHRNDHKLLGTLLGYPACCVTYFASVFTAENTDPVHDTVHELLGYSDRNNQTYFIIPVHRTVNKASILRLTKFLKIHIDYMVL